MRTPNGSDIFYIPGIVPDDPAQMRRFLEDELLKLQKAINGLAAGHLSMSVAAPAKPRAGDFRVTDGVKWNPGSGKGFYWYDGSSWTKL
mgnify:FL=1